MKTFLIIMLLAAMTSMLAAAVMRKTHAVQGIAFATMLIFCLYVALGHNL